jgi:hypothetical protein
MTFRNAASLLEPDPRFRDQGMSIVALHDLVRSIELSAKVPAYIKDQFDTARNAFVYSWFAYELATLAEQQAYAVLEMGLRHRLNPEAAQNTTRSPGLRKLLDQAAAKGYLVRSDFELSSGGVDMNQLDFLLMSRNHVMHGNVHLLPQGTPTMAPKQSLLKSPMRGSSRSIRHATLKGVG